MKKAYQVHVLQAIKLRLLRTSLKGKKLYAPPTFVKYTMLGNNSARFWEGVEELHPFSKLGQTSCHWWVKARDDGDTVNNELQCAEYALSAWYYAFLLSKTCTSSDFSLPISGSATRDTYRLLEVYLQQSNDHVKNTDSGTKQHIKKSFKSCPCVFVGQPVCLSSFFFLVFLTRGTTLLHLIKANRQSYFQISSTASLG